MNSTKLEGINAIIKLDSIEKILRMPNSELATKYLPKNRFNLELSEQQSNYMKMRAAEVVFGVAGKIMKDFQINTNSFKKMKIDFDYVHFHFIDSDSVVSDLNLSMQNFGHDLYYMIIVCNEEGDLANFDFDRTNLYDAYIVNKALSVEKLQSFTTKTYYHIRKKFLLNIGDKIRRNSTYNVITEYITFEKVQVQTFRNELEEDSNFNVRVVLICKEGNISSLSAIVAKYLEEVQNQKKLSLAFQKFDINTDSHFYDIGNMQP